MSHNDNRRQRKEYLIDLINKPKSFENAWLENELVSTVCLNFDAAARYIKEIVKDLLNAKIAFKLDKKIMNYQVFQNEIARRKL